MARLKKYNILKAFTIGSDPSGPIYLGLYEFFLNFLRIEDQLNTALWEVKISFPYEDIWYDQPKCIFILENRN